MVDAVALQSVLWTQGEEVQVRHLPGHCTLFLGKTLYFHGAYFSTKEYKLVPAKRQGSPIKCWGITLLWIDILSRGSGHTPSRLCYRNSKTTPDGWVTRLECRLFLCFIRKAKIKHYIRIVSQPAKFQSHHKSSVTLQKVMRMDKFIR